MHDDRRVYISFVFEVDSNMCVTPDLWVVRLVSALHHPMYRGESGPPFSIGAVSTTAHVGLRVDVLAPPLDSEVDARHAPRYDSSARAVPVLIDFPIPAVHVEERHPIKVSRVLPVLGKVA